MPSSDPKNHIAACNRYVVEAAEDALDSITETTSITEIREQISRIRAYLDFACIPQSSLTPETREILEEAERKAKAMLMTRLNDKTAN